MEAIAETLSFEIVGHDRASEKFERVASKVDKVSDKLDRLSHKRSTPTIDIDVDKPLKKIDQFGESSSGVMSGALKIVTSNVIVMASAVAVGLAALPAIAAAAATGIVLAFGGGLAAIGILAAAQSKKVQAAFTGLKDHVIARVKEMAAPFEPFLLHVAEIGRKLFDVFAKPLQDAFAKLAPALTVFADQLGTAFSNLAPVISPVTDAFTAILRQIGPRLPDLFKSIADSLTHVAKVVADNADTFTGLLTFFLEMAPAVLTLTAKLASMFAAMVRNAPQVAESMLAAAEMVLKGLRVLTNAALDFFANILDGAVEAMGWVPGWGDKLRTAQKNFNTFRDKVGDSLDGAISKVESWRDAANRMPKEIKLKGDIRDLEGKIDAAKAKLKTVPPEKRAKIKAEIAQLEAQVRRARAALASLRDRTVNVTVATHALQIGGATPRQHGGPVQARETYIVGERGAELFIPDRSGTIIPHGGVGGGITVNFNGPVYDERGMAQKVRLAIREALRAEGKPVTV